MSTATDDIAREGREALERFAWRAAFDALTRADSEGALSAADLEGLGEAAWWIGRGDVVLDARERAYGAYLQEERPLEAARVALRLARDHFARLDESVASGWFRRGERILESQPESIEHGFLYRLRAQDAINNGRLEEALEFSDRALEIGTRFGDRDTQGMALHDKGEALVALGRVEEGFELIDEAMVGAVGGELSPFATGIVYCNTINACTRVADYRRAGEWTEAAKRWCERQSIAGFPGICRVHRAEITRLRGSWQEAEEEARQACDELSETRMLRFAGWGFYEIGEIRLRMGDFAAAEEAFRQAHEQGRDPQPGLAQLRLAQGRVDAAVSMMRHALSSDSVDRLGRAVLLPVQAQVAVAAGDLETARAAAVEMEQIAEAFPKTVQRARAATARGMVQLAEGDASAAVDTFRRAWQLWNEEDLPYEAAQARMTLGEAYRADGDEDSAVLEIRAAKATFDKLGAVPDGTRVAALLEQGALPAGGARVVRTFMFTDIERSTNLLEAMGDEAWQEVLTWHDQTLRKRFAEHGGEEVDHTGDGFFVAFPDPRSALECATAIQRALAEHRRSSGFAPRVRIGVHASEATKQRADYRGKGVHEAARVGALASGGEIVATEATVEAAGDGVRSSEPREVSLKGIAEPVKVVTVEWR